MAGNVCRRARRGSPWWVLAGRPRRGFHLCDRNLGPRARWPLGPTLKAQTRRALEIIIAAIEVLGGKASDVVRTRIYVTDIAQWREAGEVHSEYFESIRPATTMVQVARLIDAEALVEIEADAVIHRDGG